MSCMCGADHGRADHYFDGKCSVGCCPCRQYESADGIPEERMGTAPIVEERGEWSAAPRGDA